MRSAKWSFLLVAASSRLATAQPSEPAPPPSDPTPAPVAPPAEGSATPPAPVAATPPAPVAITKPPDSTVNPADIVSAGNDKGFRFGSYGRMIAGTDLRGGAPERLLVGATGPRVVEESYLELDMSYGFETPTGIKMRPVVTLAFDGTLFHETGIFDATPALRNLFLDASINPHWTAWVGSRMYRGDDIYLFDYWPLDNQNTVGGGFFYRNQGVEVAGHVGENRLLNPYQFETVEVANPEQGETQVEQLNRQRLVASATASYLFQKPPEDLSIKVKLHGEYQGIGSGRYELLNTDGTASGTFSNLPSDRGYMIGGELSLFGMAPTALGYRRHLNLFARYASGLAAFDELAAPTSFGTDLKTTKANEISFGASGNWDAPYGNMMIGALSRRFIDSSGDTTNTDEGWEYALDARPLAALGKGVFLGADVSYQARFPDGLNPTSERAEDPAIFQVAPMLVYSPMGPSAYDRPQLRAVFNAAFLNQGAVDQYVPGDPRHEHNTVYFVGVQAEWWFNSSTYR
jgi:maltoporin